MTHLFSITYNYTLRSHLFLTCAIFVETSRTNRHGIGKSIGYWPLSA